ncbi:MAG: hypothetical protein N3E49_03170 [Bacteroidia bacterium]|nr:hypothetical protein [Bacteroidia bacterium]
MLPWTGLLCLAQPPSPLPEAYEAIRRGLTLNAQRILERAMEHPDSLVRQEAAILRGYIALKGGREKDALREWYNLSQRSPLSIFGMEAAFLRADLLLRRREQHSAALYLLRFLLESPHTPPDLRAAAERRLEYFFWRESSLGALWTYAMEGSPTLYPYVMPPLLYHLRQRCLWRVWRLWEAFHWRNCGDIPDTLRLDSLYRNSPIETLRVALVLPLMANQERSSPFLEFWQGFELGLSESLSPYTVWEVRVEDSERNILQIQELLSQWEKNPPDIIIGEVSWSLNQIIAAFCERKGIWHAVPINPAYPLRQMTFPLVPSAHCIGWHLAEASQKAYKGRGVLLYEADDPLAKAMVEGFQQRRWTPAHSLPSSLTELTRRWNSLNDSIGRMDWYALFVSQEDLVGFMLHALSRYVDTPLVIGTESWLNLRHLNLRDYRRLRLWVPQSLFPDSLRWRSLALRVRQRYAQRASLFHAQGYDAARCISALPYTRYAPPEGEVEGVLGPYVYPPTCSRYRILIWEYDKGENRLLYEP